MRPTMIAAASGATNRRPVEPRTPVAAFSASTARMPPASPPSMLRAIPSMPVSHRLREPAR